MGEFESAAKPEVEIVLENDDEVAVPMPQPGGCCRCCRPQTRNWIIAGLIAFTFLANFAAGAFAVIDAEVGVGKVILFSVVGGILFVLIPGFLIVYFTTSINNSITEETRQEDTTPQSRPSIGRFTGSSCEAASRGTHSGGRREGCNGR